MKTIITHNQRFHADDVFSVAALFLAFPNEEFKVVRTRDESFFEGADIVLDLSMKSDGEKFFDHHQPGGAGKRENGIDYASFGLIWKKFGEQVSGSKKAADIVDETLVQVVDAADNGITLSSPLVDGVKGYDVSSVIGAMNPTVLEGKDYDAAFEKAVSVAKGIIEREVAYTKPLLAAEEIFEKAYEESNDKTILVFEEDRDWKMFLISNLVKRFSETLYIVYPGDNGWRVRALNTEPSSFELKKPLPESWAGKKDEELQEITGVADAVFCHRARFFCSALSREGALALAKKAIS